MKLTPNFSLSEFACRCGCGGEKKPEILANLRETALMLEEVRAGIGNKPIRVTSGYRCPTHNAADGGKKGSFHLTGKAADIKVDGMTPEQVRACARKSVKVKGIGRGRTFSHLDTRPGPRVEFDY